MFMLWKYILLLVQCLKLLRSKVADIFSVPVLCDYPESYKENTNKEKLVLAYAENFRRQYVHLFRDRKPLFLNPLNECNLEVSYNHTFALM